MMSNEQVCGTCGCHRWDRQGEDFVCTNPQSERFAEWTGYEDSCDEWREKK